MLRSDAAWVVAAVFGAMGEGGCGWVWLAMVCCVGLRALQRWGVMMSVSAQSWQTVSGVGVWVAWACGRRGAGGGEVAGDIGGGVVVLFVGG